METLTASLIAGAVAIVGALASLIVAKLDSAKQKTELENTKLEVESIKNKLADSEKLYYVVCPNCKSKIYLSQVSIKEEDK